VIVALAIVLAGLAIMQGISNKTVTPATTPDTVAVLGDSADTASGLPPPDSATPLATTGTIDSTARQELTLDMRALKDSVWIEVVADGAPAWKKHLYANQVKQFRARDTFHVHVGYNANVEYTFNGKRLTVQGTDVVMFRIDRSGIPVKWTPAEWRKTFGSQ
jgi:hypothetical protein